MSQSGLPYKKCLFHTDGRAAESESVASREDGSIAYFTNTCEISASEPEIISSCVEDLNHCQPHAWRGEICEPCLLYSELTDFKRQTCTWRGLFNIVSSFAGQRR